MRFAMMAVRLAATLAMTLAATGLAMPGSALAQVEAVSRYKDWRVFTQSTGNDKICFAATDALDKAPKDHDHGEVTFYVATWRSGAARDQPSLKVSYELRKDLAPLAVINRERFPMYAAGPEAFVADDREKSLLAAIKKGTELRVEGAARSVRTAYYFSLKGSTEAIDAARLLCR
jgi:invasion protein IalB